MQPPQKTFRTGLQHPSRIRCRLHPPTTGSHPIDRITGSRQDRFDLAPAGHSVPSSGTELVFLDLLWPDFRAAHYWQAINTYHQRTRHFGAARSTAMAHR
ncbi:undecaprenyl diphosphate synthase family protein [Nocardia wallacei]|uniref:undecaprenyl diphosphate synthase family protein n=1 Tax=Nocardia wallacei TaxID=480035 RepID=UPI003CC7CC3E